MKKAFPVIIVFAFVIAAFYSMRNKKDDPNAYLNLKAVLILPFG